MKEINESKICLIGLGYFGLPLAVEFGKKFDTVGLDINEARIHELQSGTDSTLEVEDDLLASATRLSFTSKLEDTKACNVYIVTVPTPIDEFNTPDLSPLKSASKAIAKVISAGDIVIYESTVYPGATEEACLPIIEQESGLTFNKDFFAGGLPRTVAHL